MASEDDPPAYNGEDLDDDDDDDEPLNDVVLDDEEEEDDDPAAVSDSDTNSTSSVPTPSVPPSLVAVPFSSSTPPALALDSSAVVNVAIPAPTPFSTSTSLAATPTPVTTVTPAVVERRPIDDSRRLFQRLWTDEDEIELLQGFLEYTTKRGPSWSGHHHDTTAFYDQIKSKLQLDCNKNQLVEKLRRLKKKYRNVVNRIKSGKEFVFKSPHDQATFEISSKIWINSTVNRPGFDDDDHHYSHHHHQQQPRPNPNNNNNNNSIPLGINLNTAGDHTHRIPRTITYTKVELISPDKGGGGGPMMNVLGTPNRSRKRSRLKLEDQGGVRNLSFGGGYDAAAAAAASAAKSDQHTSVEETVKSSLPHMLKDFINHAIIDHESPFAPPTAGGLGGEARGFGSLAFNAIPMNFNGLTLGKGGEPMDERWRKQQILELEVYSKRLELVQDQIKSMLDDLRSIGNN